MVRGQDLGLTAQRHSGGHLETLPVLVAAAGAWLVRQHRGGGAAGWVGVHWWEYRQGRCSIAVPSPRLPGARVGAGWGCVSACLKSDISTVESIYGIPVWASQLCQHLLKKICFLNLFERQSDGVGGEKRGRFSTCWFTPTMAAVARAGPG